MIIRVLEATNNIPIGYQFEVDGVLESGSEIVQTVNGNEYRFVVDRVEHLDTNRYRLSNSNIVVIVEIYG